MKCPLAAGVVVSRNEGIAYEGECLKKHCAWWNGINEKCAIHDFRVTGLGVEGFLALILEEFKLLNTTIISIENKVGDSGLAEYDEERRQNFYQRVEELTKRATAAYWFLVNHFPAKSGYIDPLKPAIEAVTGEELKS